MHGRYTTIEDVLKATEHTEMAFGGLGRENSWSIDNLSVSAAVANALVGRGAVWPQGWNMTTGAVFYTSMPYSPETKENRMRALEGYLNAGAALVYGGEQNADRWLLLYNWFLLHNAIKFPKNVIAMPLSEEWAQELIERAELDEDGVYTGAVGDGGQSWRNLGAVLAGLRSRGGSE